MVEGRPLAWIRSIGTASLPVRAGVLTAWFVLYGGLAAGVAAVSIGADGVKASLLAALVCLIAGAVSLVVTALVAPPEKAAAHVLVGMMIRMSPPLFVCVLVQQQGGALVEAGFPWFLVGAFLWGLGLETLFSVGHLIHERR